MVLKHWTLLGTFNISHMWADLWLIVIELASECEVSMRLVHREARRVIFIQHLIVLICWSAYLQFCRFSHSVDTRGLRVLHLLQLLLIPRHKVRLPVPETDVILEDLGKILEFLLSRHTCVVELVDVFEVLLDFGLLCLVTPLLSC